MTKREIGPTLEQVHAYLEAHGWSRRPDDPPGQEHWQHPRRDYENDGLTFSTAEVERDGWDRLDLEFFALHEGRCEHEVLADMLGQPDPATLLQRIDELADEAQRMRDAHDGACQLVAAMHAAAVGEVRGPNRGVVEDVEDLRAKSQRQAAELNALRHAVAAARPVIEAAWNTALAAILPTWATIAPILEAPTGAAEKSEAST